MRPLEDTLESLAGQDEQLPIETLIRRLELGLRGGSEPVLVDIAPRPSSVRPRRQWVRGLVIAAAAAITVALVVGTPLLLFNRGEPATETAVAPATTIVAPVTITPIPVTTTSSPMPFDPIGVVLVLDVSNNPPAGTFVASGPAVEAGLLCPSGAVFEYSYERDATGTEESKKFFRCDDTSGSFSIQEVGTGDYVGEGWAASGTWIWIAGSGSGPYGGIAGSGVVDGACVGQDCTDEYTGQISREE